MMAATITAPRGAKCRDCGRYLVDMIFPERKAPAHIRLDTGESCTGGGKDLDVPDGETVPWHGGGGEIHRGRP